MLWFLILYNFFIIIENNMKEKTLEKNTTWKLKWCVVVVTISYLNGMVLGWCDIWCDNFLML